MVEGELLDASRSGFRLRHKCSELVPGQKVQVLYSWGKVWARDRIAPLARAQTEVRAGAVLPGSGGPEHQATGAIPQPTGNTYYGSRLLAEVEGKNSIAAIIGAKSSFRSRTFSTPTGFNANYPGPRTPSQQRECVND